jgi:NitT/TauT family transport system ATP-binding protein
MDSRKTVLFVTHSVPEAIFLSDRVVVMGPRPGHVKSVIEINLPRPRRLAMRSGAEFLRYTEDILAIFESLGILREERNAVRLTSAGRPGDEEVPQAKHRSDPCH